MVANQMHRSRRATRWAAEVDDFSGTMTAAVPHPQEGCSDTVDDQAQSNIDMCRMEARLDDPNMFADARHIIYNDATEAALRQVTAARTQNPDADAIVSAGTASRLIMRGRSANAPTPQEVLDRLEEGSSESDVQPVEDRGRQEIYPVDFRQPQSDTVESPDPYADLFAQLNPGQANVLQRCSVYFAQRQHYANTGSGKPEPLRLLVHGGPGTGKSHLTQSIKTLSKRMGVGVTCMAYTGVAAGLMPEGNTCHSMLGIHVNKSTHDSPAVPNAVKLIELGKKLGKETLVLAIIDEISFVSPEMLCIIETRLRQILTGEDGEEFGGLGVILMGDFFQLPPIPADTLFAAVINRFVRGLDIDQGSKNSKGVSKTRSKGASLFAKFRKIELTQVTLHPFYFFLSLFLFLKLSNRNLTKYLHSYSALRVANEGFRGSGSHGSPSTDALSSRRCATHTHVLHQKAEEA